jgi:uncharacterized protein (TIGR02246 family)
MSKEVSHMPAKNPADCDRLFGDYVGAGDLDSLLSLYEKGATFIRNNRSVHTGLDKIREILSGMAQRQPKISMNVFKVVEAGDDLAVLYNDWTITTKSTDGRHVETTHKAIEVVRRQPDGTWLIVFDDPFARD